MLCMCGYAVNECVARVCLVHLCVLVSVSALCLCAHILAVLIEISAKVFHPWTLSNQWMFHV